MAYHQTGLLDHPGVHSELARRGVQVVVKPPISSDSVLRGPAVRVAARLSEEGHPVLPSLCVEATVMVCNYVMSTHRSLHTTLCPASLVEANPQSLSLRLAHRLWEIAVQCVMEDSLAREGVGRCPHTYCF